MSVLGSIISAAVRTSAPYASIIELTRKCNLACRHCYAVPERGRPELDAGQIRRLLDELRELGSLFVTFVGGDPTVSREFLSILRYASDQRFAVQFFSNGLLLRDGTAEELASLRLFHVGLSIYGATAETHDRITRRPGSHEGTIAAMRRLRDRGVHVVFKFIAMNLNAHEYRAMKALAEKEGIPLKTDTVITARDDLNPDTLSLTASAEDIKEILADSGKLTFPVGPGLDDLGCVMGRTIVSINAYGDVFPCVTLPIPAGNVRYCSFREIWEESPLMRAVRKYPEEEKMHGCPPCGYRSFCQRCPGNTFTETGDLYGPSPSGCREAMVRSVLDRENGGSGGPEGEIPPGLRDGHLPGWSPSEIVALSGAGCGVHAEPAPLPVRFSRADF